MADVFNLAWTDEMAHTDPFGLNVAYADGHARWVRLGDRELARCEYASINSMLRRRDLFTYMYFKALTTRDFSPLEAAGFPADVGSPLDAWVADCCVLDPTAWTRTSG